MYCKTPTWAAQTSALSVHNRLNEIELLTSPLAPYHTVHQPRAECEANY